MNGLHPPLSVIESWTPNYTNPETGGQYVIIVGAVLLACVYVTVALRIWARFHIAKNAGIDDALIIFNLVQIAIESCSIWSTATTKISILLFYRRLASGCVSNRFLYCVYAAIAYVALSFIVWFFIWFGSCRPLPAYWLQADYIWYAENKGHFYCYDEARVLVTSAVVSASQDFIACGLPMILFWKLNIPKRQKFGLAAIFAVGIFLCVCSIIRVVYVIRVYYHSYDMTWAGQPAWLWLCIETELAVICASAPALKIYFRGNSRSTIAYNLPHISTSNKTSDDSGETGLSLDKSKSEAPEKLGQWDVGVDDETEDVNLHGKQAMIMSTNYTQDHVQEMSKHNV